MSFEVVYQVQGQPKTASVNLTGDGVGFDTAIAGGATEVTNIGVIPNNIVEVVIASTVNCTVDCGTNSPSTISASIPMVWCVGCGLTAPFAGSSLASFTIVNSDAETAGTVSIYVKTADS